ncbi:hypothetical protein HUU05_01795 [candidate division KSB1 bacterium]|nr:hypothetical protein [candidate division KSB1 bacterium]
MFAGHFAIGLALKARYRKAPTWALLLAVQLCDWIWIVLYFLQVEHFRLFFPLQGAMQLDLYDVPYSHSLFWSAFYALVVFLLFVRADGQRHWAVPLSLAVFSHWVLNWLMLPPILPFANFGPTIKFGLGLGELFPFAELVFEALIVFSCWWAYDRRLQNTTAARSWASWAILGVLIVLLILPLTLPRLF